MGEGMLDTELKCNKRTRLEPKVEVVHTWQDLLKKIEEYFPTEERSKQWIFRGQGKHEQPMESSLEREIERFGIPLGKAHEIERGMIREFKRKCGPYVVDTHDDLREWLALMRHYGAPTRLLDWTYSFFVALFFAIESSEKYPCAVWALNINCLGQPMHDIIAGSTNQSALDSWEGDRDIQCESTFKQVFFREDAFVLAYPMTPCRLNDRLTIQQGTFLCPGDVTRPFEDNLDAVLSKVSHGSEQDFIRFDIESAARRNILLWLQRMNMNRATLFPGLDGFAQSFKTLVANADIFLYSGDGRKRQ